MAATATAREASRASPLSRGNSLHWRASRKTLEALCEEKIPEGCIGLAQILQRTGLAKDRDRARNLLKSTCDAGSAESCGLMTGR